MSENEMKSARVRWIGTIKSAVSGEQHDYTSGSISRAIVLLAIPMVLELSMESLFAVCDIFWVARLGKDATAAVGLTESVLTLYYAVAIGISMSATALVARRIGEKDSQGAAKAGAQAIYLGLTFGVLTGIPCWIFAEDILGMMGASAEVIAVGGDYTRVILGANVVVMLLFLHNAIFRGAGDAALAMRALCLGNAINIVLDPLLIFGWWIFPEMGLTGAAVATLTGRSVAVVYQLWALRAGKSRVKLQGGAWRFDLVAMLRLLRVSVGGIGQFLVATSSWVFLMRVMATFGSSTLAGYTIGIRILIFTILPAWGLSNAVATLVGQNLGAGKPERAERSVWLAGWFNMGFMAMVMVVFLIWSRSLVSFFTSEAAVIEIGANCLRVVSYGYIFYAWGMVLTNAFNGAGDTMTPTWLNLICFWMVQIPLAWILAKNLEMGPKGVFWAVICADGLLAVLALWLFLRGKWKTMEV
ncbi:MAG: putative MATE family efflux protein [Verrucomicrobiales bacterium]|jgi:putative MATE family efflux protein